MERTVSDVVPALETNFAGIKEVLETLVNNYKTREDEFVTFQKTNGVKVSLQSCNHRSHLLILADLRNMRDPGH